MSQVNKNYEITLWKGRKNYECNHCKFATLDIRAMQAHQLEHARDLVAAAVAREKGGLEISTAQQKARKQAVGEMTKGKRAAAADAADVSGMKNDKAKKSKRKAGAAKKKADKDTKKAKKAAGTKKASKEDADQAAQIFDIDAADAATASQVAAVAADKAGAAILDAEAQLDQAVAEGQEATE